MRALCLIDWTNRSLWIGLGKPGHAGRFFLTLRPKATANPFLTPPRTLPAISDKGMLVFGQDDSSSDKLKPAQHRRLVAG